MPGAGLPGVFCMRTPDDAVGLLSYVKANGAPPPPWWGAGFIGLEAAENPDGAGPFRDGDRRCATGDAERLLTRRWPNM